MIFSNHENPMWNDLMPLLNIPATIYLNKLYGFQLPQGLLWVLTTSVSNADGNSLDRFVTSGVPHVTVSTPNGVPPMRSMDLLQKMENGKVKPAHTIDIWTTVSATLGGPN